MLPKASQDYSGEQQSEIRGEVHDVLLIPHRPNAPPHPPTPHRTGGAGMEMGHVGLGGGVGHWRGGVLEEYRVSCIHTHTCTRMTVENNNKTKNQIRVIYLFSIFPVQDYPTFGTHLMR